MNYQYIEQLLERYWECQTTLEEEQILRSFFSQSDVPEHLRQYADFFVYEANSQKEKLSDDFEERMLVMTGEKTATRAKTIRLSSRLSPLFKAAAVVAIALAIGNIAERALQSNSVSDITVRPADSYTKKGDITAKIKVIDQSKSEAMAKNDTLHHQPVTVGNEERILE